MSEAKVRFTGRDLLRMLPGILVSLAALAVLLYFVDLDKVLDALRLADYRMIPVAAVIFFGSVGARAVAWRTILQEKIGVTKAFFTLQEGYMLNNLLPFRLGEFGRAVLLRLTASLSFWEVLSTIVVERLFDLLITAGLLLGTLPFVIDVPLARDTPYLVGGVVLVGLVVLFLLARNQAWVMSIFDRLASRWPRLTSFGRGRLESALTGLTALRQLSRFGRVAFWMLVAWALNLAWYFVLLRSFEPRAQFLWAAFAVGVTAVGVSVPSTPAYIGVFHATTVWALSAFSMDESVALAYAIVAHALYFALTVTLGAFALGRDGQSLGQVYAQIRQRAS